MIDGIVQSAQLVVLLAANDFVRADDLLADADFIFRRRDRSTHVFPTELGRRGIGHDRGMKQRAQ